MITLKTQRLIERRWRAFCEAVVQAQHEHGGPIDALFGESQTLVDRGRRDAIAPGNFSAEHPGGAVLMELPDVDGFHQDGAGW